MIIFDNHLHLRRDGRFLDAVQEFVAAGGTHFVLCQYPMPAVVLKDRSYIGAYRGTLRMAEEIRKATTVEVFVTVGPYPVDYLTFTKTLGREKAIALMKQGMDEAAMLCREHHCIGIGEIGRPHFPVNPQIMEDSNEILLYGMQQAKEAGVPVILHTESTTPSQCKELVAMAEKAGLSAEMVVKHYAPALVLPEENHGLMPSILASKQNILAAIKKSDRFLMETDYIDDPKRPGAVLAPKTVPKRTKTLFEQGLLTEEMIHRIHQENPEKTYGISLDA
ncbi:MAG: TatD family hydrolase [Candidatus Thermoplasmatota archaeon]|nr:TatD family hydrolase [Candidatus Thermoplasmatota archaeon]